jgi:hypothetical protein
MMIFYEKKFQLSTVGRVQVLQVDFEKHRQPATNFQGRRAVKLQWTVIYILGF